MSNSTAPEVQSEQSTLWWVMVIYYFAISAVFFLTPSPYSASHTGKVNPELGLYSEGFVISPAYIMLTAEVLGAVFVILRGKLRFSTGWMVILLAITIVGSGLVNGAIYTNVQSYIYTVVSLFLASMLADYDSLHTCLTKKELRVYSWVWAVLSMAGFALVLAFPYKYGHLAFEFSRTTRGEVTYWLVLGLHLLIPVAGVLAFQSRLPERWFLAVLSAFVTVACLSTVTRSVSVIALSPYCFMALVRTQTIKHGVKRFLVLITLIAGSAILVGCVNTLGHSSDENSVSMDSTLDRRYELWQFHWDSFLADPWFGAGTFSLTRKSLSSLETQATCEIGVLTWFSEYGLFCGSVVLYFVVRAWYCAALIVLGIRRESWDIGDLFFALVFASLILVFLFEGLSRILDWTSFLFWYSMFYLNSRCARKTELLSAS